MKTIIFLEAFARFGKLNNHFDRLFFFSKIKNMQLVDEVNLDRFVGKWYEIARFPHRFEKGLVGVTAIYKTNGER